jgi:hypothetical protein
MTTPMSPANSEHALELPRPRVADCLRCVVFNVIFFTVVASPIGGIVFLASVSEIRLAILPYSLLFGTILGYPWFAVAMAMTGAAVASASIWISRPLPLYVLAGVAGAVGTGISMVLFDRAGVPSYPGSTIFFLILSGVVAAVACTRIARPFRFDGTEMYDLFKRPPSETS